VINSNDDYSSSDDDPLYYENIEYVEASPYDSELVSLKVEKIVIPKDEEIEDDNLREKLLKVKLSDLKQALRRRHPMLILKFGNDHVAKIMGYGDYKIGNVTISRVYFVEGLGHNLFSVRQFCDLDLEVAFRQHTCLIRNLDVSICDLTLSHPFCSQFIQTEYEYTVRGKIKRKGLKRAWSVHPV
nr:integrase, catalytic region, zinc finger, CCHC-type, peptidase aspartic, catalytic [Tanacetum cinerariifolium]